MLFFFFFLFGTIFWSFSTVLIERWHSGKWGIMFGRSECPHCGHRLSMIELIPILSYIFQNGKCHSCKRKISLFYPLAEIIFWILFLIVWIFILRSWMEIISLGSWILFFLAFTTWLYILYDTRYMEIPDQIMIPAIYLYTIILIVWLFIPEVTTWIFDFSTYYDIHSLVRDHFIAAASIYTFFYIQILIPGSFFLLKHGKKKEFIDLVLSYLLFPILLPLEFIKKPKKAPSEQKEEDEIPTWIGGGDLRIAIFIGITLWSMHSFVALGIAYIIGSFVGIFLLIKWWRKNSQISFWPFLWIGWTLALLFHNEIITIFQAL